MFNGHLTKNRVNFSHRRMKTTFQSIQRSGKKQINKQQKCRILLEHAKVCYYKQANFIKTVQLLEQYLEYKSNDNQVLYLCGVSYLHLNQPYEAINKLQKISSSFAHKQQSLLLLSMSYGKICQQQKSLQVINQCLLHYPSYQQGYCYRGKLYLKFEQYELSLNDYLYSLQINPQSFICRIGLGDCYYQKHQYELALKYYGQAIECLKSKNTYKNENNNASNEHGQSQQNTLNASSNSQTNLTTIYNIQLKTGKYQKVIEILQKLSPYHNKYQNNHQYENTQYYYYLGMSYIKQHKKSQGILNLEYCIKLQSIGSIKLIQKSFKTLIQLHLNDYQFYQATNLLKLLRISEESNSNHSNDGKSNNNDKHKNNQDKLINSQLHISCKYWKNFVQGAMLIIKSHYHDGLEKLNEIYDIIKGKKHIINGELVKKGQDKYQNQFISNNQSQKPHLKEKQTQRNIQNPRRRKSFSLKHVRKVSLSEQARNKTIFKSIEQRSTISKQLIARKKPGEVKMKVFFKSLKYHGNLNSLKPTKNPQTIIFTEDETIFIMPILLKFKAYGQSFINNYLRSLDTYQQYQSYMKNVFGKDVCQVGYNRFVCEAFLLNQTQLYKQSLEKFDGAIQQYKKFYNTIPTEPLLYKISTLLRLALPYFYQDPSQSNDQSGYAYLQQVLDIQTQHSQLIQNHHISHYYLSIMYFLCQKYTDSQNQLEKTLKLVQQCTWKYLYFKGCVQLLLQNYYEAIKQFTAGLILEQTPDLYLGRAISFLLEGTKRKKAEAKGREKQQAPVKKKSLGGAAVKQQQKHSFSPQKQQEADKKQSEGISSQLFIENSFQDLQKFIEQQSQQDKISLWVTKLLFYNEAYEEALRALQKVENKCSQMLQLQFWLKLYEGQFQECGQIGTLIMDAFQGKVLNEKEQSSVLVQKGHAQIIDILKAANINASYQKWVVILHLFKRQKYSLLIKYIQKHIFQCQSLQEQIQLKYNIAIAYLMNGDNNKAFHSFQNLISMAKQNQKLTSKLLKFLNYNFSQDQCLPDLSEELYTNGNHQLSQFLPYKMISINDESITRIFIKPSIPFPQFPKPNILIKISKDFIEKQLDMELIEKRIDAPWIKRNKEKIQFTEEIVEAYTDFLKDTKQMVVQNQNNNESMDKYSPNNNQLSQLG